MAAVLFRVSLLALGMGIIEISLGGALLQGSIVGWAIVILIGLPLVVAGSAGFIGPLLGGPQQKGSSDA